MKGGTEAKLDKVYEEHDGSNVIVTPARSLERESDGSADAPSHVELGDDGRPRWFARTPGNTAVGTGTDLTRATDTGMRTDTGSEWTSGTETGWTDETVSRATMGLPQDRGTRSIP